MTNEKTQKLYYIVVWNNSLPKNIGTDFEKGSYSEAEYKYKQAIKTWDNVEIVEETTTKKIVKSTS